MAETEVDGGTLPELPPGTALRRAREVAQIELAAVAAWTRIGQHHLAAIERGDYAALPAPMYAVAFARSYARAIGLDDQAIARQVRAELDRAAVKPRPDHHAPLEDPARIPSKRLTWTAAAVAAAVLVVTTAFWRSAVSPAAELPRADADDGTAVLAPELSPAAQVSPTAESAVAVRAHETLADASTPQSAARAAAARLAPAPRGQAMAAAEPVSPVR